ncbi:hypothetical protein [Actinomyces oris]|uniref:hypothetical protein n=1 Tax=Actinomyces oris TaxID=544580 RepID=UPI0011D20C0D|nr:hypothetical protein [Actinomyces oris]
MPPATSPADADHDDTAPTNPAGKSTGQAPDTEARDAERGATDIAQRLLPALPTLRTGALLSVIGAVVLFFAWGSGVHVFAFDSRNAWWTPISGIPAFWALSLLFRSLPHRSQDPDHGKSIATAHRVVATLAISGIVVCAVRLIWKALSIWSSVLSRTGINTVELAVIAAGTAGLALLSITDILIRTLRAAVLPPELYQRKWWRRLRKPRRPDQYPEGPRRRTLARAALVLAPSVLLAGAAAVPLSRRNKAVQKLTPPSVAKTPPAYPTSMASEPAWVKDIDNVLDIVAGAAGPVIHTTDGILGINPLNGSTLWSYARKGATYETFLDTIGKQAGKKYARTLVVSPSRRHIAFRISGPGKVKNLPITDQTTITIVLDTITGQVVNDHISDDGTLQITDSAILDGHKIYTFGSKTEKWDLKKLGVSIEEGGRERYFGTAGHSTFIVGHSEDRVDGTGILQYGSLSLISQDDPSQVHATPPVPLMGNQALPLVIGGWTAIFSDGTPTTANGSDDLGWQMHVADLDSLAKPGSTSEPTHHIGRSAGINAPASLTTGKIVMLPATLPPPARSIGDHDDFPDWDDSTTISTIFDPSTQTTLSASQTSGLIRAVGISSTSTGSSAGAEIKISSMVNDTETSFPISPGSVFYPPGYPTYNPDMKEIAVALEDYADIFALRTPGANIIILNPTARPNFESRSYRLYGITEATQQ